MKILKLRVKGADTIGDCLVVSNGSVYTDTIVKGQTYTNTLGKTIRVTNICDTTFVLSARSLFAQTDAYGSTFIGSMVETTVPANSFVDIQVYYNGTYKSNDLAPFYTFVINGKTIQYTLTVTVVVPPDTPGTLANFTLDKTNREGHTFGVTEFTSRHADADGDTVTHVLFSGDVSTVRYNGAAYVADTQIPVIDSNKFSFVAPDQDAIATTVLTYKVKDSKGNIVS